MNEPVHIVITSGRDQYQFTNKNITQQAKQKWTRHDILPEHPIRPRLYELHDEGGTQSEIGWQYSSPDGSGLSISTAKQEGDNATEMRATKRRIFWNEENIVYAWYVNRVSSISSSFITDSALRYFYNFSQKFRCCSHKSIFCYYWMMKQNRYAAAHTTKIICSWTMYIWQHRLFSSLSSLKM